jgi:hypothetical protein
MKAKIEQTKDFQASKEEFLKSWRSARVLVFCRGIHGCGCPILRLNRTCFIVSVTLKPSTAGILSD